MNPFEAASSAVKLAIVIAVAVVVGLLLWWLSGFVTAKATVNEIKATTRAIAKANKVSDADAAKRAAAALASEQAIAKQIDQLKDSPDETLRAELARPLHPERVRLANCALRGPERESGCQPATVR